MLRFLFTLLCALLLTGCASSSLSRQGESSIDDFTQSVQAPFENMDPDPADIYQNTSQASKGLLVGGASGAVVGAIAGGVGGGGIVPSALVGAATGAVIGGIAGAAIDAHANMRDQLANRGVTIVVLGDQILIAIPSARIFDAYSSTINPSAYSTLDLVARYINRYVKMLVKITVYTADQGTDSISTALSQDEADTLVKFFSRNGLDARVLYGVGAGDSHLVVHSMNWDSDNYRIEITLQKLYF